MTTFSRLQGATVAVVGAGIVGSTIAYRLSQAGAAVTLIDRSSPGTGTSGSSFAWLNAFRKPPRAYHRLSARSVRAHRELAEELRGDWLHLDGALVWYDARDADKTRQGRENARTVESWGYRVERATPEVVMRELEPDLTIDPATVEEIYVMANEGWLDAPRMAHAVVHTAQRRHGLKLVTDVVIGLKGAGRGVDAVVLEGGDSIGADIIINSAGPDAGRVAALAGTELAMTRQPGAFAVTGPVPNCLRHVVRAPEAFIRADGGGRLVIHRDQYDSTVDETTQLTTAHPIADRARSDGSRLLPALAKARVESMRLGIRAMPKDGYPIVGFDDDVPGLYHVVTHSGVTLAAGLGIHVTEDLGGLDVPELAPFRPGRFRVTAIKDTVPEGE